MVIGCISVYDLMDLLALYFNSFKKRQLLSLSYQQIHAANENIYLKFLAENSEPPEIAELVVCKDQWAIVRW